MKLKEILQLMKKISIDISIPEPKFCGGLPRDRFMNRLNNISDLDFTNGAKTINYLSEKLFDELKKEFNITRRVMEDGHSSIYIGETKFDFSSNFNIPNIENIFYKMGIKNFTNMDKEIYSRDFTCNALLLSLDLNNLIDITKRGCDDIDRKKIVTCLDPQITLVNSKNRVIRSIYLACKLDFDLDEKIINFVKKYPQSIKISSEKTLVEKLNQAFEKDGDKASFLLSRMNLWNYVPITEIMYPYYKRVSTNV